MNVISRNLKKISVADIAFVLLISCMLGCAVASESDACLLVSANVYDLDEDSHYVIGEASPSKLDAIGTFSINGDVRTAGEENSFPAYKVSNGNASFIYAASSDVLEHEEEEWHIMDDKNREVNGLTLDENILSGALIVQTSLDGVDWTEDVLMSDIFSEESSTDGFLHYKGYPVSERLLLSNHYCL